MINRHTFYEKVRNNFGRLKQSQVDGIEAILDKWDKSGLTDLRWLAYILATAWHETARTMQPVEEYGKGKGRRYGKPHPKTGKIYYGRGQVQLTWYDNYRKMGELLGIDLVNHPELALDMNISTAILFEGMTTGESFRGDFTGKHLGQYFNDKTEDWTNARRIINGLDKANLIGGYGRLFYAALAA